MRGAALAAVVALTLIPAAAASKPAAKPQAARDWSRTVSMTSEGGFRMGNPAAKVKLVEYGSLACPHCRHFEQTGYKPLIQNYVRAGKVSYEFRNMLISGPDISMSLLTRCAGPGKFFAMSDYVFATQPDWQKKIADMTRIAARYGVTPARSKQCLADPKGLKRLLDMTQAAIDRGVHRTPTFIVNGKVTDAATWEELEPLIREAGGSN